MVGKVLMSGLRLSCSGYVRLGSVAWSGTLTPRSCHVWMTFLRLDYYNAHDMLGWIYAFEVKLSCLGYLR